MLAPALQVGLLLDVLREMAPLAAYPAPDGDRPLLLSLLAHLLSGRPAALATPASRAAFLQLAAGLCGAAGGAGARGSAAAAAAAGGGAPLLTPAALLAHVVAPALEQQLLQGPGGAAEQLTLALQLAEALLPAPTGDAATAPGGEAAAALAPLRPQLSALLDLDARRVDRSAAALEAGPEPYELAAALLQRGGSGDGAAAAAAAYFSAQLQPAAAAPGAQQLQQLRRRMLPLMAALLPCLTAAEAAEVLQAALPATIQAALTPGAAGGGILPGAHAAAVEAACRAAQALALQPAQAPLAGEAAATAGEPPSALRQAAVERLGQHLVQHCVRLAAAGPAGGLQLAPAEAQALGLRCFRELCGLVVALAPAGLDCATLQAGVLRLAQQLVPAGGGGGGEEVRQALLGAAAALPADTRELLALAVAAPPS